MVPRPSQAQEVPSLPLVQEAQEVPSLPLVQAEATELSLGQQLEKELVSIQALHFARNSRLVSCLSESHASVLVRKLPAFSALSQVGGMPSLVGERAQSSRLELSVVVGRQALPVLSVVLSPGASAILPERVLAAA